MAESSTLPSLSFLLLSKLRLAWVSTAAAADNP
jgi:hypothetical protein